MGDLLSFGTEPYNEGLSRARASAVFTYLVSKGVDPDRLVVNGYGELKPPVANISEENRTMNRRVEFNILNNVSALQTAQFEGPDLRCTPYRHTEARPNF